MIRRIVAVAGVALAVVGCERKLDPPKPDTVVVTLAPAELSADDGETLATAFVTEKRVPLKGFAVSFQVILTAATGADPSYASVTAVTDVNGRAELTLSGLTRTGQGDVTATVLNDDGEPILRGDVPVAGSAPLRVRSGAAATLDATLSATSVDLDNVDSIEVSYLLRDGQGNPTAEPIEIVTDHPGASVLGTTVSGLGVAGTWSIAVSAIGNPSVSDTESFQVLPGATAMIDVFLSNATTDAYADPLLHPPVTVGYVVADADGNDVTGTAIVACTIDVLSGGAVDLTSREVSPLVVKGTFPVTCTLEDAMANVLDSDSETLTVLDLTPPAITIASPAAGTHFASGADVDVTVNATDVVGVTAVTAQVAGLGDSDGATELVTGDGALNKNVTKTFTLQAAGADSFGGTQTIYATGLDGSGNVANAPAVSVVIDPFTVMPSGISPALVREDPSFSLPLSIVADPNPPANTARLFVGDIGGGGVIWRVDYDRITQTSTMIAANTGLAAMGLELDAAGTQLFATSGNEVHVFNHVNGTLTFDRMITIPAAAALGHAVFGPTTVSFCPTGPCLYISDPGSQAVVLLDISNDGSTVFASNATPRDGGGPALDEASGIAYDPTTSRLFVSDGGLFGGGNDVVYELAPDGADGDVQTDSLRLFMDNGTPLGPDPDLPCGLEYRGLGGSGLFADQVFTANLGDDRMLNAVRDGGDGNFLSDSWGTFLEGIGRTPIDLSFQAGTDRMYVLFSGGNGMDEHVVELSGF